MLGLWDLLLVWGAALALLPVPAPASRYLGFAVCLFPSVPAFTSAPDAGAACAGATCAAAACAPEAVSV